MVHFWEEFDVYTCYIAAGIAFYLPVIGLVALIAYGAKSRLVFVVGAAGATLGWALTGSVLPISRAPSGLVDNLGFYTKDVLFYSVIFAAVSLGALALARVYFAYRLGHRRRFQFSLRELFIFTTIVCVIAWLIHLSFQ